VLKRRELNLIVCSGKSKAEVTNNRRVRSLLLKLPTDRHKASRGLSVTAGLLVFHVTCCVTNFVN